MPHVSIKALTCAGLAALLLTTATHAQSQANTPPAKNTLSISTRLVVLDVAATDAEGKPVSDLKREDFRIFEDGVLQEVRSFEAPSLHALPAAAVAGGDDADFDPAQPAAFGQSPVTILVLDQMNTHFADSSFARRCLRDFLRAQPDLLPAPAVLLLVSDKGLKQLHPFTRSREKLLAALAAAPTHNAWQLEQGGSADYGALDRLQSSLFDVEQIAQSYAGLPLRKNLLWVGGGFPSVDPSALGSQGLAVITRIMQHLTDLLLATRVTLNAVDPSSSAAGMTEIVNEDQADAAGAIGESLGTNSGAFDAGGDFDHLALQTGGRVVRGRNDVAAQIGSAVQFGQQFYVLSYKPSATSDISKFRRIRVVSVRPGVIVTTRLGYYSGATAAMTSTASATFDLTTAAQGDLPLRGLRVTARRDTGPRFGARPLQNRRRRQRPRMAAKR